VLVVGLALIAAGIAAFWLSGVESRRGAERVSFGFSVRSASMILGGFVVLLYYALGAGD
jgi:hypothetical protein